MIPDKEANIVYFSELIRSKEEHKTAFGKIQTILNNLQIEYKFLTNTKDIWCRDYMPVQINREKFVQFKYEPSYLRDNREIQSDPKLVLQLEKIKADFSNINLDGGNVIKWTDKVIMTRRIFKENLQINRHILSKELERLFEAEVLFIPDITKDMTGHADGHLRFINEKTILVNELRNEFKYWQTGFLNMVKQAGFDFVEMPWFKYKDRSNPNSAIGCYVNYLEIGDLILFPIFETKKNKDDEAVTVIKKIFPDRIIETININQIAREGGLLNCITWTIKQNI